MDYPFKYPEVYAELARQGKKKKELADVLEITVQGLRYKQTHGEFGNLEMIKTSSFLQRPVGYLFAKEQINV